MKENIYLYILGQKKKNPRPFFGYRLPFYYFVKFDRVKRQCKNLFDNISCHKGDIAIYFRKVTI